MVRYTLPPSLAVKPGDSAEVHGEIIVVFLDGPLCGETYRPLGLNALWALIGALATLGETFCFWIKPSMIGTGPIGGFVDGQFYLFENGERSGVISVMTAHSVETVGSPKVTVDDRSYGMFYWVPQSAMMPFDDLVRVGNALLMSKDEFVRTEVGQSFKNWTGDKYSDNAL